MLDANTVRTLLELRTFYTVEFFLYSFSLFFLPPSLSPLCAILSDAQCTLFCLDSLFNFWPPGAAINMWKTPGTSGKLGIQSVHYCLI